MTSPVADSVMAATHKLVQQAMSGQWHEVPKTVEERRLLLDRLAASAAPQDQQWLSALRQAMVESDAAVQKMAATASTVQAVEAAPAAAQTDVVGSVMDMITKGR
ncbi:MAG: hypothetical protein ACREUC_15915 [Steroidobacteraceae bacterium]